MGLKIAGGASSRIVTNTSEISIFKGFFSTEIAIWRFVTCIVYDIQ